MKQKIRQQIIALAKQLIDEEKTFKTASVKELMVKLYEKLTVLEYLEKQLEDSSEIHIEDSLDSKSFREENWFVEPTPVPQPDHKEDLIEPLMEKIKDIVAQMPEDGDRIDELIDEVIPQNNESSTVEVSEKPATKYIKNELEEFASSYQKMPEFERKQTQLFPDPVEVKEPKKSETELRSKSINDSINKGLNIGLNDRLAFIKHLFEGKTEDYSRVLSQINTMENYEEAQSFINGQVKPDYNYWLNKEVYSERFLNIIEKSFN